MIKQATKFQSPHGLPEVGDHSLWSNENDQFFTGEELSYPKFYI